MKTRNIKSLWMILSLVVGIVVLGIGIYSGVTESSNPKLNGILYGIGAGLVGASIAQLATIQIYNTNRELLHKKTIEVQDERNVLIKKQAKSKVFDLFNIAFPIFILVIYIAGASALTAGLLLAIYGLRIVVYLAYLSKYNREL